MKKKILFKIQQFPHLSETFILSQIIIAIEQGYNVKILVKNVLDFEKSAHSELLKKYKISNKIILDDYKIPKNKTIRLFQAGVILSKNIDNWKKLRQFVTLKSGFSLTWIYEFYFYKKFKNIDIIHVQYGTNVHPVDILKKVGLIKGQLIVSFHGHDAFFPINGFIPNNGYYDNLFSGDNLIIANTPYLAGIIRGLGCPQKNLSTIPIPVDTKYFTPLKNIPNNEYLQLVTVGRLDPIKGHLIAVNFIDALRKKGINIRFTIVGEGQEYQNIKERIKDLSLENLVDMVGSKCQKEVRRILRKSDVYIFTGVPVAEGRRETQGLATLEAQACGLPILAFDSGGVKYTIKNEETGFLCLENDLECLVNKLRLLTSSDLREEMGGKARVFVENNFSKKEIKKKWKAIYDDGTL